MKALLFGVAAAMVAGVMSGGWLRYEERPSEVPEGPQQLVSGTPARLGDQPDGGMVLTIHNGQVPDHVVGTDWLKGMQPIAYQEPDTFAADAYSADDYGADAFADEPIPEEPAYPGLDEVLPADRRQGVELLPLPPVGLGPEPDTLDLMIDQIARDAQIAAVRIAGRTS